MARFKLSDLNPAQRTAATTTEGPLLILAGAGTGKTRVITMRVAYMVERGVDPAHILAVTFTNKAAAEMRERLAKMIEPAQAKKVTMSTFHALCLRILRANIDRLGYKQNFSIYDEGDQLGLIKKIITRTAAKDEKLDPNVAKALISKAKNTSFRPQRSGVEESRGATGKVAPRDPSTSLGMTDGDETLVGAVFARYRNELKTANAVDFDDLLLLTVQLLSEHPDVQQRWRERFRYIMVDEFQDTNRLQLELVRLLADERRNVAVVGDDDQSIYGWRGAEVSNILDFEHHFPNPQVVKLEENYRSTNAILNTANSLIKHNPRRRPKSLWSSRGDGDKVRLIESPNDREEAQFVAEEIHRRHQDTEEPWEGFAVLFRMNAQSRLLEENLRRLQIPYRIVGGKSFFDRREVKDLIAYMSVLANPGGDANLLRIINTPARGISAATVETALHWSVKGKCSLWDALQAPDLLAELSARTQASIKAFVELIEGYQTTVAQPLSDPADIVTKLIAEIDYGSELRRSCKTPEEASEREANIGDMLRDLRLFNERSTKGLEGFLDEIVLDQEREEDKQDDIEKKKGVTLITMHAAKGLEFRHVYLIGLEEGLLPHDRSKTEGTVDEERRLLYVGITRAKRTLTLSHCRDRMKFGSVSPCYPSSFIKELAPEWLERVDLKKLLSTPVPTETGKNRFAQMRAAIGG
ncbi:MAG: ATP-dependent DNA helicase UvrD/PcrA [uncultured Chthoniobacterales bacterium]|uniref:DNA 3'-5' helicase n=1 Tax=uncultured Chthoniobacterales bacterium TaxID=1836801 RepID=A0A6J4HW56_9BACT|nr:MAG: ATP-dependent DNA helicase UvrD/PcrA [uncultured Chthoniobacterales bacterium]